MRFLTATTLGILILAILLGLVAAYGIRMLMREKPTASPRPETTVNIPIASVDLPEGRTLMLGDVVLRPMTRSELEKNDWLTDILASSAQVLGRTLKKKLPRNEPFRPTDFYLEGQGPTYLSELPEGYRAVSVNVPTNRGGYAMPGNFVDVVFRAAPMEGSDFAPPIPDTTITLIENAKVLAVERATPQSRGGGADANSPLDLRSRETSNDATPPTIILAATPKQANAISAVIRRGELSLVTRPAGEAGFEVRPPATSLEDILGLEPPIAMQPPPPPFVTEIYLGGNMKANAFAVGQTGASIPLNRSDQPIAPQ